MSQLAERGVRRPAFCGQPVSEGEWELLREVVDSCGLSRSELANTICETLGWKRANGRLKARECFEYLGVLDAAGLLAAPALRGRPRGATIVRQTTASDPQGERRSEFAQVSPVTLQLVSSGEDRALWRELVDRHHYLGHKVPFGAHLRYLVWMSWRGERELAGCLQYSSAARRLAARDRWIGWDDATRARQLSAVACNSRFLILPWVHVPHLASHVLALGSRVMVEDWLDAYRVQPVLLETFVDPERFDGTCYRAANWIELGATAGRGRMDRHTERAQPVKTCLVSPLVSDFRRRLGVR